MTKTEAPEQEDRFDAYDTVITDGGDPKAPRMSKAWTAMHELMTGGKPRTIEELTAVTDLAEKTVRGLLDTAIRAGKVEWIVDGRQARSKPGRIARKYRIPAVIEEESTSEWEAMKELLADGEPRTLAEIVDATGIEQGTVQTILQTAVGVGMIRRVSNSKAHRRAGHRTPVAYRLPK